MEYLGTIRKIIKENGAEHGDIDGVGRRTAVHVVVFRVLDIGRVHQCLIETRQGEIAHEVLRERFDLVGNVLEGRAQPAAGERLGGDPEIGRAHV